MTLNAAGAVPVCPSLQLANLSHGKLSFRARGEGETMVFLHGLLGSSKSWAFQFEHFARKYRVIAWDAPGFGQASVNQRFSLLGIRWVEQSLRDLVRRIQSWFRVLFCPVHTLDMASQQRLRCQ